MAGSGLIQLVAYGAQDIYLTGSPQITFFKVAYRRHTNFAMESIEQTFTGQPDFGKKVTVTVSRNGDLITRAYLQVTLPNVKAEATGPGFSWIREIGHFLIKQVDIDIGGQRIDRHYGEWLSIWSSLTLPAGKQVGYHNMIGHTTDLAGSIGTGTSPSQHAASGTAQTPQSMLYIPLIFWFNRHPGLALPLIALQYHDVRLNIEFRSLDECFRGKYSAGSAPSLLDTTLYIDYIYLDTDERRRFAMAQHEYLIEQLQFTGDESVSGSSSKIKLSFNHPVKELIWVVQSSEVTNTNKEVDQKSDTGNNVLDWSNFTTSVIAEDGRNPVKQAKLQLNGHDRFSERKGSYFNWVQPYQHHSNVPPTGVNVYSFALNPEEHQPSGTLNFSRIDNATLQLNLEEDMTSNGKSAKVKVFAHNYNVLRIMSGMGGLAYAS
jgi:hypothetical protein